MLFYFFVSLRPYLKVFYGLIKVFYIINVSIMRKLLSIIALLVMSATMLMAQTRVVTGTVTSSEDGEPIIGASVIVPGTQIGTVTDVDGNFSLKVPEGSKTLRVSYVGMNTQDATIKKGHVSVVLDANNQVLDDVVVTAQGLTRKDKSIGYAAQKIDAKDLSVTRQTDLGNSLAGKVAGARFIGGSGATFDAGKIVLRGTTDFTSPMGSEPIYVVDGVITSKNAVNMDDVESLNVLKGAAATALYGSHGANGAIIITTKKADSGKGRVEVSQTTQWMTYYNHIKLQNQYGGGSLGLYGERYAEQGKDNMGADYLFSNYGDGTTDDGAYIYDMYSDESWGPRFDANVKVNTPLSLDPTSSKYGQPDPWVSQLNLKDLFQTGLANITNVAVSKAGVGYNTRISFTNNSTNGLYENSEATRRYFTVHAQIDPVKWLTVRGDYKLTYRQNHNAATEGYGDENNVFYDFVQWGHTNVNIADYKDYSRPDGSWRTWNAASADDLTPEYHDNPYAILNETNRYSTDYWHVMSGEAIVNLPYNIKAAMIVDINHRTHMGESEYPEGSINYTPYYAQNQYTLSDITLKGRLTYGGRFIDNKLSVDAAAFVEQESYNYNYLYGSTTDGLIVDKYWNINASSGYPSVSNSKSQYKTRSVYGTVTLGYNDTYFLDGSLRNDWDSRLAKEKNSYLYGSLSASVMLNKFVDPEAHWLDYWKVRASAAQVGSTLSAYALADPYYTYKYNSNTALYQSSTQINKSIEPTISTSYEVGTEFRMFKNRLWGDFNWYTKDTKNQILDMDVVGATGYAARMLNAGLIRNRGIEISLGGSPVKTKNWQWDVNVNLAKNWNKLVELSEDMDQYTLYWNRFYYNWNLYAQEGKPIGVITTSYRWNRDDEGNPILAPSSSSYWGGGYAPTYDSEEKEVGNFQPDLTGGFSTSLRWKNLMLGASFDFMVGGQMVSWTNMWATCSGMLDSTAGLNDRGVNVREALVDNGGVNVHGVTSDGQAVDCYMNAYAYYHYLAYYDNDNWIYDRTYLKLRELSLTYQFSKHMLNKLNCGLSEASVSFIATNPWLIYSACPNVDPSEMNVDTSSSSSEMSTSYIEGGQAPSTRTFGLTVKLAF